MQIRRDCLFVNELFLLDLLVKELLRQANDGEIGAETVGKKRKRTEQTDENEDVDYLTNDNELFVAESGSAMRARKSGERAEIEAINLVDDLDDD
jgi:hypothetical protein